jgi:heat shock protein HslJ
MKNKKMWKFSLALVGIILAACGGMEQNSESNASVEGVDQDGATSAQLTMIIGSELVDCVGEGPQQCMQIKYEPDEDWQFFYSQIEGFDYQPGYTYTLLVERIEVENPPAGGSSLRYIMVEVLEKVKEMVENAGQLAGYYWVLNDFGSQAQPQGVQENVVVSLQYDPEQGRVSGSAGCNNYFGEAVIDEDQLTFSVGPLGMTRMACGEEIMQQEAAFVDLLARITRFVIQEETLVLFTDSDEMLTFSPGEPPSGR